MDDEKKQHLCTGNTLQVSFINTHNTHAHTHTSRDGDKTHKRTQVHTCSAKSQLDEYVGRKRKDKYHVSFLCCRIMAQMTIMIGFILRTRLLIPIIHLSFGNKMFFTTKMEKISLD